MKIRIRRPHRKTEEIRGGGIGSFPTTTDPTAPISPINKGKKAKPTSLTQGKEGELKEETRKSGKTSGKTSMGKRKK